MVGITNPGNSAVPPIGNPALPVMPAQLQETRQPDYPEEARRQNAKGSATVFVTLTSTGEVHDAQVAVSSGNPWLDVSALLAALGSRYIPARVNGKPSTQPYKIQYSFPR